MAFNAYAAVSMGRVGAVFSLEDSRLGRSSADWHHSNWSSASSRTIRPLPPNERFSVACEPLAPPRLRHPLFPLAEAIAAGPALLLIDVMDGGQLRVIVLACSTGACRVLVCIGLLSQHGQYLASAWRTGVLAALRCCISGSIDARCSVVNEATFNASPMSLLGARCVLLGVLLRIVCVRDGHGPIASAP